MRQVNQEVHAGLTEVWRKSSYCVEANCVEVRVAKPGSVAVRDNTDPDGPALQFSVHSWRAFIAHIASAYN